MKPEHRARLLELAAARGEKGFSNLVADALDHYLEAERKREGDIKKALALEGSLTDAEADELRGEIKKLRSRWR
jgi:hypothetical protein